MAKKITVQIIVNEPIEKVWDSFTNPKHIVRWNHASADWRCPRAENDLRVGGRFSFRMEAKDGSEGFDFGGTYKKIVPHKHISYVMDGDDKRKVEEEFEAIGNSAAITITFDAETENTLEMQKSGWQSILANFRDYTEHLK